MRLLAVIAFLYFVHCTNAAFGYVNTSTYYEVDSGAGLVVRVDKDNGNIISIMYNNSLQLQDRSRFSHIGSGLGGAADVFIDSIPPYIKISINTSTLTHYLIFKEGENNIYMGTFTTQEPGNGELRFIARLNRAHLPYCNRASDIYNSSDIEGGDIFKSNENGETRSKFYSGVSFLRDRVHGVSGDSVGAYFTIPDLGYEGSSGGPFFRDIIHQGITYIQEIYFYMNSGHAQTEGWRMGFHGPYILSFTPGPPPSGNFDTSFYGSLNLLGYVPLSGRGYVRGKTSGIDKSKYEVVAGFKNSEAQYWTISSSSDGSYTSPAMKPGNYTVTLFKKELEVKVIEFVTVEVGKTLTLDLASEEVKANNTIFQLGDFDGTPEGFMNADKIERAHPSDSTMSPWVPSTFVVGDNINTFPMAIFMRGLNSPVTIQFNLSYVPPSSRNVLNVGITLAFEGARPTVKVNNWSARDQGASSGQPDSRGITKGTWRGINKVFSFSIPTGTLVNGSNTIQIGALSGSCCEMYLSPNFIFDSVQLNGDAVLSDFNIPTNPPTSTPSSSPSPSPSPSPTPSSSPSSSPSPSPSPSSPLSSSPLSCSTSYVAIILVALLVLI